MTGINAKKIFSYNETYLALVLLVFCAVIASVSPVFLDAGNLLSIARTSTVTAILAIGVFIVLISGGVDVSGMTIAISAQYIAARAILAAGIDNIFFAFAIAIVVGVALGAVNAVFVSIFKIPALIVTLGTSALFHGALLTILGSRAITVGELPQAFRDFGGLTVFGLSAFVLILAGCLLLSWFILNFTVLGRGIYALGGNEEAAKRVGFNTHKIQFFIFCYAGFLAGIMGVIHISLIQFSSPMNLVGTELTVISAVVLGGAKITGGSGTLTGTMLGVALIMILERNLILLGIPAFWQTFFVGAIIVVSVTITSLQDKFKGQGIFASKFKLGISKTPY